MLVCVIWNLVFSSNIVPEEQTCLGEENLLKVVSKFPH